MADLERILVRIHAVLSLIQGAIGAILLTVFACLVSLMLAAWAGLGGAGVVTAGVLGLLAGAATSRRVWFPRAQPLPPPAPAPDPWRYPGIQDEFERRLRRQQVLGFLLIVALLALVGLRFALQFDWPIPLGIEPMRLLAGALLITAAVIPLGLWNWRCPSCRRNLGSTLYIRQCPKCGVVLRG